MSTKLLESDPQRVAINGSPLKWKATLSGLLQGQVTTLELFCLFINGLEDEIKGILLNMEEPGITFEDRNIIKILMLLK